MFAFLLLIPAGKKFNQNVNALEKSNLTAYL